MKLFIIMVIFLNAMLIMWGLLLEPMVEMWLDDWDGFKSALIVAFGLSAIGNGALLLWLGFFSKEKGEAEKIQEDNND